MAVSEHILDRLEVYTLDTMIAEPPFLPERSKLEILGFSPASASKPGHSWIHSFKEFVQWIPSSLEGSDYHGFSADDSGRVAELEKLLKTGKFIMGTRGGWGSLRLLKSISLKREQEGILCGFSDLTTLLNILPWRTSIHCFHGPMFCYPQELKRGGYLHRSFEDFFLTRKDRSSGSFEGKILGADTLSGPMVGGNLSVFTALAGTTYLPDLSGKVLFLEEINEPTYRVDRMLTHLSLLPGFERLRGIIFGGFTQCLPSPVDSGDMTIEELLEDFHQRTQLTIVTGAPIGHLEDFLIVPIMGDSLWTRDGSRIFYELMVPWRKEVTLIR